MRVSELSLLKGFTEVVLPNPGREIKGAYIGDLLSWVMGRATEGDAWITIMTNVNILAVAQLTDVACIILAEGTSIDDELISVAKAKGINVISTMLDAYAAASVLAKMGI